MFEIVYDGRRTDGRRLNGYTISSPCEPNGSGELKIQKKDLFDLICCFTCTVTATVMPSGSVILTTLFMGKPPGGSLSVPRVHSFAII